jgi:hypothetical protein
MEGHDVMGTGTTEYIAPLELLPEGFRIRLARPTSRRTPGGLIDVDIMGPMVLDDCREAVVVWPPEAVEQIRAIALGLLAEADMCVGPPYAVSTAPQLRLIGQSLEVWPVARFEKAIGGSSPLVLMRGMMSVPIPEDSDPEESAKALAMMYREREVERGRDPGPRLVLPVLPEPDDPLDVLIRRSFDEFVARAVAESRSLRESRG